MNSKCLWLTFRKIIAKSPQLEGKKVSILLKTSSLTFELQCFKYIKKGIANLYGESISLPLSVAAFTIFIIQKLQDREENILSAFDFSQEQIATINQSKKIFRIDDQVFEIVWEGSVLDEDDDDIFQESQDANRDFSEMQMPNAEHKRTPRTNIVYQRKSGEEKMKKRTSFRLRKEKSPSQPIQEYPLKYTSSSTQDTAFRTMRKKSTFESLQKIIEKSQHGDLSLSSSNIPIRKEFPRSNPGNKKISQPIPQQLRQRQQKNLEKQKKIQRQKSILEFLNKLNYQLLICIVIVGIICILTIIQF